MLLLILTYNFLYIMCKCCFVTGPARRFPALAGFKSAYPAKSACCLIRFCIKSILELIVLDLTDNIQHRAVTALDDTNHTVTELYRIRLAYDAICLSRNSSMVQNGSFTSFMHSIKSCLRGLIAIP